MRRGIEKQTGVSLTTQSRHSSNGSGGVIPNPDYTAANFELRVIINNEKFKENYETSTSNTNTAPISANPPHSLSVTPCSAVNQSATIPTPKHTQRHLHGQPEPKNGGMKPTAPTVNREAVRVLAIAVGVREAARRMGLSVERVMKWSQRGNWLMSADASALATPSATGATAQLERCPQPVRNAGDALRDVISNNKNRSILAGSSVLAKKMERLDEYQPDEVDAQELSLLAGAHAKLHGSDQQSGATVNVALLFGSSQA